MKPTFFVFLFILFILITLLPYHLIALSPYTPSHSVTVSATVDPHLSYHQDGQNLIISTNKPEGFVFISPQGTITKKGPVVLTVPAPENFILISGY